MDFKNLSDRSRLLIVIIFLAIISLLITFFLLNIQHSIILSIILCVIMYISRPIWLPDNYGKNIVRKISLGIALAMASSYFFWQEIKSFIIINIINVYLPKSATEISSNIDYFTAIPFVFILLVIWIVNYYMRDTSAMGINEDNTTPELNHSSYYDRLKRVSESLKDEIRSIDIQTNWSIHNFIPLQAEVEIQKNNGRFKKVTDLFSGIKKSNERLFLVLGDPGSGKSVALRKLASDLLSETKSTKKIPIYINLREWKPIKPWSVSNPPTLAELTDFVKSNLKNRDIITSKFFEKYFENLYENGHLYFIMDSFDEIPAVLNEKENSELIGQLSSLLFQFLKGARSQDSQGILASRVFRKPTKEFQCNVILEIRPFNEDKIISTLQRSNHFDNDLINDLFKNRIDLVPVSRNPFTLNLLSNYVENNNFKLPENQSAIYSSYVINTLTSCEDRIIQKNLTVEKVIVHFKEISNHIFENYGMEASIKDLIHDLPKIPVSDVIDIISFSKIGRKGTGDGNIFSYSHRRFCEYFAVQYKIENKKMMDLEAIPTDSQWRDAMVLYCEVADEAHAKAVANFCWAKVDQYKNLQNPEALHCLRFLNDAFKGRLNCLEDFRSKLSSFIEEQINESNNIISTKLSIESVGLLDDNDIDSIAYKTLSLNNSWLNETCIRSFRHLKGISPKLDKKLIRYLNQIPSYDCLLKRKDLEFSLKLSEGFKNCLNFFNYRRLDSIKFGIGLLMMLVISPVLTLLIGSELIILNLISKGSWRLIFQTNNNRTVMDFMNMGNILSIRFIIGPLLSIFSLIYLIDPEIIINLLKFIGNSQFINKTTDSIKASNNFMSNIGLLNTQYRGFLLLSVGILITPFYKYFYLKTLYDKPKFKKIGKKLIVLIMILVLGPLLIFSLSYLSDHFRKLIAAILIGLMLIIIIIMIYDFIKGRKIYKNISFSRLNNRDYIQECYVSLDSYKFYQYKLITYIEHNIKDATGKWKDDDFLNLTSNPLLIRIAKLEEKWLGLNR